MRFKVTNVFNSFTYFYNHACSFTAPKVLKISRHGPLISLLSIFSSIYLISIIPYSIHLSECLYVFCILYNNRNVCIVYNNNNNYMVILYTTASLTCVFSDRVNAHVRSHRLDRWALDEFHIIN